MLFNRSPKAFKSFSTILLCFTLLLLFVNTGFAQFNYKVEGTVKYNGTPLSGAIVSIYNFDSEKIKDITTGSNGGFSFSLKPDEEYNMLITKPGFITVKILYSTIGLSAKGAKFTGVSNPEIEIFEMPQDPKLAAKVTDLLNKPLMSYYYSADDNKMVGDNDIQQSMEEDLTKLKKQAEGPASAAAEIAAREAKYNAAVGEGDKAMTAKNYKLAKDKYTEASDLKPAEQYPKTKIAEADKLVADASARDKALADAAAKEKADKEKATADAAAKEKADKEKALADAAAKDKTAKDKAAADAAEKDKLAKEKALADAAAKEKADKAKADATAAEQARIAKDKAVADAAAKEKADKAAADAAATQARIAREKVTNDSIAKVKSDKAAADAALAQARSAKEKVTNDSIAKVKSDKAAADAALAQARSAKEKATNDSIAKVKSDKAAADAKAEQDRVAKEKVIADAAAKEKADKIAADAAAEKDRIAKEKAIADAAAKEKADKEKAAADAAKAEQDRIAKEKAIADAAAKEKADKEKAAADAAEKERLAKEEEKRNFENNYKRILSKGDSAITVKNYPLAKTAFNDALKIKPDDDYPKNKLKDIDVLIANFDLYKNDLAKKYPVGVTEEHTKEGNNNVTRRIVVIENKGYLYEKKETTFGTVYYFKDGIAITESEWKKNTEVK